MHIPRPCGAVELYHNKPVLASSLIPRTKEREVTDDEISPLVMWLTDEQNSETDIYGVVEVPIDQAVADAIMALIHEPDPDKQAAFLKRQRELMAKGIESARERADARVMRACGKMYNVVKATRDEMKKNNLGQYAPSFSEALALEVMKDAIKARNKPDERAVAMMNTAMDHLQGPA